MGKAKRKLNAARKACYDPIDDGRSQEAPPDYKAERLESEYYDIESSLLIQRRLIEYANKECWPLCEFLDITNTENFMHWILHHPF